MASKILERADVKGALRAIRAADNKCAAILRVTKHDQDYTFGDPGDLVYLIGVSKTGWHVWNPRADATTKVAPFPPELEVVEWL